MTGPTAAGGAGKSGTRTLSAADFAVPVEDRYFEDYQVGAVYEYGYATVTEAEILAFARQFDPQPMHVDPAFAAAGPFGGLIASGWHTAGIFMRLFADHYLSRVASLASPGIDELRWPAPLRPGDTLRLRTTIIEARVSRSKPDRGLVRTRGELLNSGDAVVLSLTGMNLVRRRPAGGTPDIRDTAQRPDGRGGYYSAPVPK
jgi:acyl dehydratase